MDIMSSSATSRKGIILILDNAEDSVENWKVQTLWPTFESRSAGLFSMAYEQYHKFRMDLPNHQSIQS